MNVTMPTRPLLLRTSSLSPSEKLQNRIAFYARQVTAVQLSKIIGTSVSTARRRRTGRGWMTGELFVFAGTLGIAPSSFFEESPAHGELDA